MNSTYYDFQTQTIIEEMFKELGQAFGICIFLSVFFFLVMRVIVGILCKHLAAEKGYKGHFGIGFFLGLIGMLYVAFLPDKKMQKYLRMCSMKMQLMDARVDKIEDDLNG